MSNALATWMPFCLTSFSIFWLIVLFVYHLKKNIVAEIIFSCQKTHQSNEGNKSCVRKISTVEMGGGEGSWYFSRIFGQTRLFGQPANYQEVNHTTSFVTTVWHLNTSLLHIKSIFRQADKGLKLLKIREM